MPAPTYDNIEPSPLGARRYIGYAAGLIFTITPVTLPRSFSINHCFFWRADGPCHTIFSDSLHNLSLCLDAVAEERLASASQNEARS